MYYYEGSSSHFTKTHPTRNENEDETLEKSGNDSAEKVSS
jgi:hypothetical protein